MTDTTYNGWTNYATWRVNLEMFDGYPTECIDVDDDAYDLGLSCKDWAEELICMDAPEGLARDYAMAFISDVNWREIAQRLIDIAEQEQAA